MPKVYLLAGGFIGIRNCLELSSIKHQGYQRLTPECADKGKCLHGISCCVAGGLASHELQGVTYIRTLNQSHEWFSPSASMYPQSLRLGHSFERNLGFLAGRFGI